MKRLEKTRVIRLLVVVVMLVVMRGADADRR